MFGNLLKKLQTREPGKLTFWVAFALLAAVSGAAELMKFSNLPPQFIGHGDRANMAILARNIAEGNGAVVDVIWFLTNGGIPGNDLPTPEPYWSIYVAAFISIFFLLFGAGLVSMLAPAVLMKISVAAISAGIALRLTKSTYAALSVAVLLLYLPVMTRTVDGLSDIYLTFFVLCTALVLAHAITQKSRRLFFFTGTLIGIAVGVKPSGLLLLGLLLGYLIFSGHFRAACGGLATAAIGVLIGLLPLMIHNYQGFNNLLSPAYSLAIIADRINLVAGYNAAFFNPDPVPAGYDTLTMETELHIAQFYLKYFSAGVLSGKLFPTYLLPFVALGVLYVLASVRSLYIYKGKCWDENFSYISLQMLIAAIVLGSAVPWEVRYWNFVVPFLAILTATALARLVNNTVLRACACAFIFAITLSSFAGEQARFQSRPISKFYERVAQLVPPDAVVMCNNPWQLSFHTRRRAVILPYTDKDSSLINLAERYGVEYIVFLGDGDLHPKYQQWVAGNFPDYLEPVQLGQYLKVLKFKSDQSEVSRK